jgi:hypothetical protein
MDFPIELINKILSFREPHPIVFLKQKKVINLIRDAMHSRKNCIMPNDDNRWVFWTGFHLDTQFQAENCIKCGEYIIYTVVSSNSICRC